MSESGTVVAWHFTYGFIRPDGPPGADDRFVHFTNLTGAGYRSLTVGDRVSYRRVTDAQGRQTVADVVVLNRKVA